MPLLAKAAASRKTVFTNQRTVSVTFRNPEFYTVSGSGILTAWENMRGDSDELVNPVVSTAVIAGTTFTTGIPVTTLQRLIGFKVKVSGNTNINTGAQIDATARINSMNNNNLDVQAQLNLKDFSVEYYHFFAKEVSQIVEPANQMVGEIIAIPPSTLPTFFEKTATYFGSGPDGLTVQIEPLNSRHPDVLALSRNFSRAKRFLSMVETKYKYLCDMEEDYWDEDLILFDEEDLYDYDLLD